MADNDTDETTTGTYLGITRSPEPFWRSGTWTPSLDVSPDTMYFVNASRIIFNSPGSCGIIDGISDDPIWEDPDLRLPEGL